MICLLYMPTDGARLTRKDTGDSPLLPIIQIQSFGVENQDLGRAVSSRNEQGSIGVAMSSQDAQIPTTILFPRAAIALARMSAVTLMVTFGLTILFLAAAILVSPGSMRSALADAPVAAQELPQESLAAGPQRRGEYDF